MYSDIHSSANTAASIFSRRRVLFISKTMMCRLSVRVTTASYQNADVRGGGSPNEPLSLWLHVGVVYPPPVWIDGVSSSGSVVICQSLGPVGLWVDGLQVLMRWWLSGYCPLLQPCLYGLCWGCPVSVLFVEPAYR